MMSSFPLSHLEGDLFAIMKAEDEELQLLLLDK